MASSSWTSCPSSPSASSNRCASRWRKGTWWFRAPPAAPPAPLASTTAGDASAAIRARVAAARARQNERFAGTDVRVNARMTGRQARRWCALPEAGAQLLGLAVTRLGLSARAHDRILKVARTVADLAGAADITAEHVSEAIQYRGLDRSL